jgi:ribonuclease Z
VSDRELIVLGTASQAPTRERNHNGYVLRFDDEVILFDPGEGTQRQMLLAGVSPASITRICITHFHGDHCLGLPGLVHRLSLDQVERPVEVHFPASGQVYFDRLCTAAIRADRLEVRPRPVHGDGVIAETASGRLQAAALDHTVDAIGYRLTEPDGRRMLPDELATRGIEGPDIGRVRDAGAITVGGRRITLAEVSAHRPGQAVAFVMDTRWCDGALRLAQGADLLVCEATFCEPEAALAEAYGHLTAAQAGRLAARAGARRLVLTHFSQRYPDEGVFAAEAAAFADDVVAARDLHRVSVPDRVG